MVHMNKYSRVLRLVPHFKENGWNVVFLTEERDEEFEPFPDYMEGSEVVRVRATPVNEKVFPAFFRFRKRFFVPEFRFDWVRKGLSKGKTLIKKGNIDLIYATTHYTNFVIAHLLSDKTGVPWVGDYADPWTGNVTLYEPPSKRVEEFDKNLEGRISSTASSLITVTERQKEYLIGELGLDQKKMRALPISYSHLDMERARDVALPEGKLVLLHLGVFYDQYSLNFFEALKNVISEHPNMADDIRVILVGPILGDKEQRIIDMGLGDVIAMTGRVPFYDAMGYLKKADVDLMLTGGEDTKELMTTKLIEYMGSGKPVLAVLPPGSSADEIVQRTGIGVSIPTDDLQGIEDAILDFYQVFKGKGRVTFDVDRSAVEEFDSRTVAEKMAEEFERVLS